MTVRELIAELSKYPPDVTVVLVTRDTADNGGIGIESVERTDSRIALYGFGWDEENPDEDDEEEYGDEAYDYFDDEDEEDDGE